MLKFVLVVAFAAASYGASIPENVGMEPYVVGGKDTDISQAPYQVALLRMDNFYCGGVILSRTMILTTAACVMDFHGVANARIVDFRVGSSYSNRGGTIYRTKTIWSHPHYNPRANDNDVAVIELKEPLTFSDTVQPIELATSEPEDGDIVTLSGYGSLREGGEVAPTLQSVDMPFVKRERCAKLITKFGINEKMVCAGEEGKDACHGDAGSPLVYKGKLLGISSFGIGCGRKDSPGVYTSVVNREMAHFIRKMAEL